jgi:hypothetical protein
LGSPRGPAVAPEDRRQRSTRCADILPCTIAPSCGQRRGCRKTPPSLPTPILKLEPDAFSVWAESVLGHCGQGGKWGRKQGGAGARGAVEGGCVLWLVSDNDESNANLLRQAKERGIDRGR